MANTGSFASATPDLNTKFLGTSSGGSPTTRNYLGQTIVDLVKSNTANLSALNVKNYGAAGNGTADDTSAIQSAINAAAAAGKNVYFPKGTYKLTAELTFSADSMCFFGDGAQATTVSQATANQNAFHCNSAAGVNHVTFEKMTITGPGVATSTGSAIKVDTSSGAADGWSLLRLRISGFQTGLRGSQYSNSVAFDCAFLDNATHIHLDDSSNSVTILGCSFVHASIGGITGIAIRYSSGDGMQIIGNDFGGPHQLKALLLDGGNFVSWKSSNCECYATTDGYIDHQVSGTFLSMENVAVRAFTGAAGYSLLMGQCAANLVNVSLEPVGANGGVIKASTINSTVLSNRKLQVDTFASGVFVKSYPASLFYTITQSDGVTPGPATLGAFKMRYYGGSSADDTFAWTHQLSDGSYVSDNLVQYNADKRANLVGLTNQSNTWANNQIFGNINTTDATKFGVGNVTPQAKLHVHVSSGLVSMYLGNRAYSSSKDVMMVGAIASSNDQFATGTVTGDNYVGAQAGSTLVFGTSPDTATADTVRFKILKAGGVQIVSPPVPTAATDPGVAGQVAWDSDYFYVCVAANTWKRTALSTW